MANNIRGITIEIEGKTSGLTNALKSIDSQLSKTDKALKELDKALKLDPGNTELVARQQELLAQKADLTAQRLDVLKQVQKDALDKLPKDSAESSAKMAILEAEIATTDSNLQDLTKEEKKNGTEAEKASKNTVDLSKAMEGLKKAGAVAADALKVVGKALAGAGLATGAAAVKLSKDVIESFGELEQNLGGSEAVFGDYAKNIQAIAEDSYKTLGTTQSEYLATANIIGALFQGSGVEVSRSLDLTTQAMQRAADMASVMGIDTETALEAIKGAAKGNYTMMDNLGVAMNATTLQSYALSKGMKTAFKDMSNAEKAELAMQYFFENTSKYAGNFEREATETISGSFTLLETSYKSLIAGLGNQDADVSNLTDNLVSAFEAVVNNIEPILENLSQSFPVAFNKIISSASTLLPQMLPVVQSLLDSIMGAISANTGPLLATLGVMISQIVGFLISNAEPILEFAGQVVLDIVSVLMENGESLMAGAMSLFNMLLEGLTSMLPELIPVALDMVLTLVETILDPSTLNTIIDAAFQIIFALVDGISSKLPVLIPIAIQAIQTINAALIGHIDQVVAAAIQIILALISGLIQSLPLIVAQGPVILEAIVKAISKIPGTVSNMAKTWGADLIDNFVSGIKKNIGKLIEQCKKTAQTVKDYLGFSCPKLGPLSSFDESGGDLVDLFAEGINDNIGTLKKSLVSVGNVINAGINQKDYSAQLGAISGQLAGLGGTPQIVVPVTIGGTKLDTVIVDAVNKSNFRSGGH